MVVSSICAQTRSSRARLDWIKTLIICIPVMAGIVLRLSLGACVIAMLIFIVIFWPLEDRRVRPTIMISRTLRK